MTQPNILFIMTDQQRFDTIAALGNSVIHTPNLDRLVDRGLSFTQAYSTCPVCVAARMTIRTGREPPATGVFSNRRLDWAGGVENRCGNYLARTLSALNYRTFGIGKFHTDPWDEDLGYDWQLHSEELYKNPRQRLGDAYAAWIAREHPNFDYVEALMGERTEMYYVPQVSPLPAHLTVESWVTDRTIEALGVASSRPFFGFVSFIGPHPPFAPPLPFNRIYDPDRMTNPVCGDLSVDHMDEQIPSMNQMIWADEINDALARNLKARYYGEITYIDDCLGRILDVVESREDSDNTLICFFSDHGDHLGDHNAWQKESFFDVSTRIPFLISWPARLPKNCLQNELVCLTDLFGIATQAAGKMEVRDGVDVLGIVEGLVEPREYLFGYYGEPGTDQFKIMVRSGVWKYIYFSNGGRSQLFNMAEDPQELVNKVTTNIDVADKLNTRGIKACQQPGVSAALDGNQLRSFPYTRRKSSRIYQFDESRGVDGFPNHPHDVIRPWIEGGRI
tara:strand:- start:6751 stop:8265 length:1515 start_codon:yes stop_codon:yes gene_type:complete